MYGLVLAAALTTGGVAPQYGNYGCWGCSGCSGCQGNFSSCGGCFGYTNGGHGCSGGCSGGTHMAPVVPGEKPKEPAKGIEDKPKEPGKGIEKDKAKEKDKDKDEDTSGESTGAQLNVEVPADARLYINGQLMRTASARRTFDTPPLEKGRVYSYTLRTEVVRGGKKVSDTRRVEVRAGAVTNASFLAPARGVAAARR